MMSRNFLLESEAFSGMNLSAGRDIASILVTDIHVTADLQGKANSPAAWSCP